MGDPARRAHRAAQPVAEAPQSATCRADDRHDRVRWVRRRRNLQPWGGCRPLLHSHGRPFARRGVHSPLPADAAPRISDSDRFAVRRSGPASACRRARPHTRHLCRAARHGDECQPADQRGPGRGRRGPWYRRRCAVRLLPDGAAPYRGPGPRGHGASGRLDQRDRAMGAGQDACISGGTSAFARRSGAGDARMSRASLRS